MDQVVRGRSTTSQDEVVTHGVEACRRNAAGPPIFPSEVVNYVCILEYECNPTLLLVGCAAGQSCNIRTQATASRPSTGTGSVILREESLTSFPESGVGENGRDPRTPRELEEEDGHVEVEALDGSIEAAELRSGTRN